MTEQGFCLSYPVEILKHASIALDCEKKPPHYVVNAPDRNLKFVELLTCLHHE